MKQSLTIEAVVSFFAAAFVIVPYCYLPAAFVAVVVGELSCKAHHVQRASGAGRLAYWAAHYAWDFAGHALLTLCLLLVYAQYAASSFAVFAGDARAAFATGALTLTYGLSALPLGYCYAPLFESRAAAQVGIAMLNFATGYGLAILAVILENFSPLGQATSEVLYPWFRLSPSFSVAEAMLPLVADFYISRVLDAADRPPPPLRWEVGGRALAYMGLTAPVFFALAVAADGRPRQELRRAAARAPRSAARSASTPPPAPPSRRCRPSRATTGRTTTSPPSAHGAEEHAREIARHDAGRGRGRGRRRRRRRRWPRAPRRARRSRRARSSSCARFTRVPAAGRALARRARARAGRAAAAAATTRARRRARRGGRRARGAVLGGDGEPRRRRRRGSTRCAG